MRTFEGHTQGVCIYMCRTSFETLILLTISPGISCIQFDDTRIVSGSWDKTIKVRSYVGVTVIIIIVELVVYTSIAVIFVYH